jgi:hypothetical protein
MKQALDELQVLWVAARDSWHAVRLAERAVTPQKAEKGLAVDLRKIFGEFVEDTFVFTKDRLGLDNLEPAVAPRAENTMGGPECS